MKYNRIAVEEYEIPQAAASVFQHLIRTYASEINKLNSVWQAFDQQDLSFKPHARSSTVGEIIEHELLSERRFFAEFLGLTEVPAEAVLPSQSTPERYAARMVELSRERLNSLARQNEEWWFT